MRALTPALVLAALAIAVLGGPLVGSGPTRRALADDATDMKVLAKQVRLLEARVAYLDSREADLSAYVLRNEGRASKLQDLVARLRAQGFTGAADPSPARAALLDGIAALATDLSTDLPKVTKAQEALRQKGQSDR
jgi:hypothetical protein